MADIYVKFDDVIKAIGGVPKRNESPYPTPIHLAAERIITRLKERITKIPTADVVEVKHGKWKLNKDGSGICSECGRTQKNVWDYDNSQNFCGHCGAKMDGGKAE